MKNKIKFQVQHDAMDCGPACLSMVSSYYGKLYDLEFLRRHSFLTRDGVSLAGIREAAKKIGLESVSGQLSLRKLVEESLFGPVILHWNKNHFVVLCEVRTSIFNKKLKFKIADPAYGIISLSQEKFESSWISSKGEGIALFLSPTENFYSAPKAQGKRQSLRYLFQYLASYKTSLGWLTLLLLLGSATSLVLPLLTQQLIDKGVTGKNLSLVTLILFAQLSLYVGSLSFAIIRNRITLIMGAKINIRIISEFLRKILTLPIRFFETKFIGDFNQRIADHGRIESFLTSDSLSTFFSMITFLVFFGVLWFYDFQILMVYLSLTIISILWSLFWMRKLKILDYLKFQQRSENQQSIYEIINGVTEIKLNQLEEYNRLKWEEIQRQLFKVNTRILKLNQWQSAGFEFLNQVKNILVTFIAATLVIKGGVSLGALLSISYIIGQMNAPVNQLMNFFRSLQDARLSLERLREVQEHPEEEEESAVNTTPQAPEIIQHKLSHFLNNAGTLQAYGFELKNVGFQYEGPRSPWVVNNISLTIPPGKITAIVGASGSGKTTLMKLLLKFYEPISGDIFLGDIPLNHISHSWLRKNSGAVMQDGFIFSETIERNIVCGDKNIDKTRLERAMKIACIDAFVDSLPLKLNTKIGASGNGLSGGQKQRVLIARAVYKNPQFLFFDEATSALDAANEKSIHDNLQSFFSDKTVVVIAHRLSTVKKANQIIVLKEGKVAEAGTHLQLVSQKADYYHLVKNQLELGV